MIHLIWAFCSFVYYKIMASLLLDFDISLSGAIVMGITTAIIIFITGGAYVLAASSNLKGRPSWGEIVVRCTCILIAAIAINSLLGYLISIGFSGKFAHYVFGSSWRDDSYWFVVMCAGPMIVHFGMSIHALSKMRFFL